MKSILVPVEKYEQLLKQRVTQIAPTIQHGSSQSQERIESQLQDGYDGDTEEQFDVDTLVQTLPKPIQQRGRALLLLMSKDPARRLSWDTKGQLIYNGRLIVGSHIADLIKDSQYLYKRFEPIGMKEFYQSLKEMNVPKTLIGNKQRLEDPIPMRSVPPGIPVQKIVKKKLTFKWKPL